MMPAGAGSGGQTIIAARMQAAVAQPSFFLGNAGCCDMPLDESNDTAGPEAGFLLAFGFFGSRLPRFIPLAIVPSRAVGYVRSVVRSQVATFRACDDTPSSANADRGIPPSASRRAIREQARCRRPERRGILNLRSGVNF
jgi:hypothetical protein